MTRLTKEIKADIEQYILNAINSEDTKFKTDKDKMVYAINRFKSEYGFNIERMGIYKAFSEWLQGLALDIAFYNGDILELAKKWGQSVETEKEQDKILNEYWDFMTSQFFRVAKKYKVEVLN